ncbi:MAG TPA: TIGR03118 family protein [Beijerinckiaceae bacterium]|nr:TIGR03118 family protein [Beijerinckiaceae bacterium]
MNAFTVVIDNSAPDDDGIAANYKGVALSAELGSGLHLYAANFSQNSIDVFDGEWRPVDTEAVVPEAPGFRDAAEYAPFNIERVFDPSRGEDVLIAAYAKVADAAEGEEEPTDGFVVKYALDGKFLQAGDAEGAFNAPWGVAMAPEEFGSLSGDLLVGNFGDGRILALDVATLDFEGYLLDEEGEPVEIDGLWDLIVGNGASLGAADRLYFSAGPEEETHGLFGSLSLAGDDLL